MTFQQNLNYRERLPRIFRQSFCNNPASIGQHHAVSASDTQSVTASDTQLAAEIGRSHLLHCHSRL